MADYQVTDRRPIAARELRVMHRIAGGLARRGVSANAISIAGMLAGIGAGVALAVTPRVDEWAARALFVVAAVGMQLRLLANLFDGMVAIASGKASAVGELYNEVPDRVSDSAVLIGAGYAIGATAWLGYVAALLAMATAYLRATGKAAGARSHFLGPMAKQQRMAVMTVVCLVAACVPLVWLVRWRVLDVALAVIITGSAVTCVRRLMFIARDLRQGVA